MKTVMNVDELTAFMFAQFPQMAPEFTIDALTGDGLVLRMQTSDRHLRPGGTVSGPTMFGLADCAFYLATLSRIGPVALAVTTNCSIDFMRKPEPGALVADARILKLGRMLSVGDVVIRGDGDPRALARASLTYAIPPKERG